MDMGTLDFWQFHGWLFLILLQMFPRLTLLIATTWGIVLGPIFWWVGLVFVPRLMAAFIATVLYGGTNTTLVVFAWIFAILAEVAEKGGAVSKARS